MLGFSDSPAAAPLSDEDVLQRSQLEPWLFGIVIDRYQAPFIRKVSSIVRDNRDVEEVVQDTFVKIYQNAHRFVPQPGANFSSWAYRILLNTAYTCYQRQVKYQQRTQLVESEILEWLAPLDGVGSVAKETRDGVERILNRLPVQSALVLRLHYLERWPQQAIAQHTGETVGTIKTRIFRAKRAFFQQCRPGEFESLL